MQDQSSNSAIEQTQKAERSGPIPLADRRRLVRSAETQETTPATLHDWASI